ncbi:uncharacterized protein LOC122294478 isoform X2 [Carya illinoinensis]|nr:uncharacterized protein LOC122294478 isoform X2 [Carya illinoinensis]
MQADEDVGKISMAVPLLVWDIVSKVPDLGGSDAAGEDHSAAKRRKVSDNDENDSDDESKRSKMEEAGHTASSGGRRVGAEVEIVGSSRTVEKEVAAHSSNNC